MVKRDLAVTDVCIMPVGYGVGDHRMFVVDFTTASIIGKSPPPLIRPAARRVNTKIEGCAAKCNTVLEKLLHRHKHLVKLKSVTSAQMTTEEKRRKLELIDKESGQYQRRVEKKC
mmetsp:Transcript_7101/g.13232  ORF Transcript_7101/g.13232 Transcript_7101/m.13232 type:complete len:115 (-) Transcript_7101:616-960(-)